MISPMSGAPGVGQKLSPFDRTEISVLVSEYLDKLTITTGVFLIVKFIEHSKQVILNITQYIKEH